MFTAAYARFRGGKWFLIALAAIVGFWIGWNSLPGVPHFDGPDFGRLNVLLSIEASLSVAVLIMAGESREVLQRKQLDHIETLMEQTAAILERLERPL